MRPLLKLVRTLTPARVRDGEVAAVYAAGWDEHALHDAVSVCALFNFMNRLVEGLGITAAPAYYQTSSRRLAGATGFAGPRDLPVAAANQRWQSGGLATAAGHAGAARWPQRRADQACRFAWGVR